MYMRIYICIMYTLSSRTYPAYLFHLDVPRQLPNSSKTLGRGKPRTKILDQGVRRSQPFGCDMFAL